MNLSSVTALTKRQHLKSLEIIKDFLNTSEQIVFIDWDDTLFPTTEFIYLSKHHHQQINNETKNNLAKLSIAILNLFRKYKYKNIFIVTNSAHHWIRSSLKLLIIYCKKHHIPSDGFQFIDKYIKEKYVYSISAKSLFEKKYPKQPIVWKSAAFKKIIYEVFIIKQRSISQILVVGDSLNEMIAGIMTFTEFPFHIIKFRPLPTIIQILKGITMLTNSNFPNNSNRYYFV
jgi:hypothetical protein